MTKEQTQVLRHAIAVYGPRRQAVKALEELGELTQALCKWLGGEPEPEESREHLFEEMADVEIMLAQLRAMNGADRDVDAWIALKIARLKERLDAAAVMAP